MSSQLGPGIKPGEVEGLGDNKQSEIKTEPRLDKIDTDNTAIGAGMEPSSTIDIYIQKIFGDMEVVGVYVRQSKTDISTLLNSGEKLLSKTFNGVDVNDLMKKVEKALEDLKYLVFHPTQINGSRVHRYSYGFSEGNQICDSLKSLS